MLQAMNTGHEGSLSTAHANSPRHLLWRLETMALMSDVELPVAHVREQVASAIDVIVHMARLRDGRRVVHRVATVDGVRDGEPVLTDLFAFRGTGGPGGSGRFMGLGSAPPLARVLEERGEILGQGTFGAGPDGGEAA